MHQPLPWWLTATDDNMRSELELVCASLEEHETITTGELVERMLPNHIARLSAIGADIRRGLFSRVQRWTRDGALRGIYERGEARLNPQKMLIRPYIWHAPREACPHCSGHGYLKPGQAAW